TDGSSWPAREAFTARSPTLLDSLSTSCKPHRAETHCSVKRHRNAGASCRSATTLAPGGSAANRRKALRDAPRYVGTDYRVAPFAELLRRSRRHTFCGPRRTALRRLRLTPEWRSLRARPSLRRSRKDDELGHSERESAAPRRHIAVGVLAFPSRPRSVSVANGKRLLAGVAGGVRRSFALAGRCRSLAGFNAKDLPCRLTSRSKAKPF